MNWAQRALWNAPFAEQVLLCVQLTWTKCSSQGSDLYFNVHDAHSWNCSTAHFYGKIGVDYGLYKWCMLPMISENPEQIPIGLQGLKVTTSSFDTSFNRVVYLKRLACGGYDTNTSFNVWILRLQQNWNPSYITDIHVLYLSFHFPIPASLAEQSGCDRRIGQWTHEQ